MKKRLLIFHPYLAPYRIDLYNRLSSDFKIEVLLTGAQAEFDTLGFDLTTINSLANFSYSYYSNAHYLGRHPVSTIFWEKIKRFKPDIVLAHEYGINTIAAILAKPLFSYKLFLTCDDSYEMASHYHFSRKLLRRFVVNHTDGFLCVSTNVVSFLESKYPKRRFIHFPIIQDDYVLENKISQSEMIAEEYKKRYDLDEKKTLLFVGRLIPEKGVDLVIDAFCSICTNNERLIIVGDGQCKTDLVKKVRNLGITDKVLFTGALSGPDLYAWYFLSDLFVLASFREAFGAVVNEALVSGCKSIVSNNCGACTLISKTNGVIFESGNTSQLATILKTEFKKLTYPKPHKNIMSHSFDSYYNTLIQHFNNDD